MCCGLFALLVWTFLSSFVDTVRKEKSTFRIYDQPNYRLPFCCATWAFRKSVFWFLNERKIKFQKFYILFSFSLIIVIVIRKYIILLCCLTVGKGRILWKIVAGSHFLNRILLNIIKKLLCTHKYSVNIFFNFLSSNILIYFYIFFLLFKYIWW